MISNYRILKNKIDGFVAYEREKLLGSVFDAKINLNPAEQAIIDLHLLMGEDLTYSIIYKLKELNPELYEEVCNQNKKTFIVYNKIGYKYDGQVKNLGNRLEIRELINEYLNNPQFLNMAKNELINKGVNLGGYDAEFIIKQYLIENMHTFNSYIYDKIYGYNWRDKSYTFAQKVKDFTGFEYQVKLERVTIAEIQGKIRDIINNRTHRNLAVKCLKENNEEVTDENIDLFIIKNLPKFDKTFYARVRGYANHQGYSVGDFFLKLGFTDEGRGRKGRSVDQIFLELVGENGLKSFRNASGCVDSYRKNPDMKLNVQVLSVKYAMPPSVVVSLVCGEKLKSYFIESNYINETKIALKKFLITHDNSLYGITNDRVYDMMNYIKTYILLGDSSQLTTIDVVKFLLGDEADSIDFGDLRTSSYVSDKDRRAEVQEAFKFVKAHEGNIIKANVLFKNYSEQYRIINTFASKIGISLEDAFNMHGMTYETLRGKPSEKMKKIMVQEIPFINEMKEDVKAVVDSGAFDELSETEKIYAYLEVCKKVYEKYNEKSFKINNEILEKE